MSDVKNEEINSIFFDLSKKYILPKFKNLKHNDVKYKNNKDIVTSVDIEVEEKLNKILSKMIPNSLFIGEELYNKKPEILNFYSQNQYCWTVDPIDGTNNFVKGKDNFAIMLALTFKEKILQSWIFKPLNSEFSYAINDGGAYINGKKFIIKKNTSLFNCIGSISSKYWEDDFKECIIKLKKKFQNINSYGCIGLEYIDIIKSLRDFTILSKLSPWDHLPGILMINESGGSVSHFDNEKYNYIEGKNNLIVANSLKLKNEIINLIKECKYEY